MHLMPTSSEAQMEATDSDGGHTGSDGGHKSQMEATQMEVLLVAADG